MAVASLLKFFVPQHRLEITRASEESSGRYFGYVASPKMGSHRLDFLRGSGFHLADSRIGAIVGQLEDERAHPR